MSSYPFPQTSGMGEAALRLRVGLSIFLTVIASQAALSIVLEDGARPPQPGRYGRLIAANMPLAGDGSSRDASLR